MDHPLNNDDFTIDPRQAGAADALDRALDALATGNRRKMRKLDPTMRETVDHMFALADVAGMTGDFPTKPFDRPRLRAYLRPTMTWLSVAAVIVLLAVLVNQTFPNSPLNSGSFGTMAVTPDATQPDYPVMDTSPFSPSDCRVEQRPRDQVAAIIGIPPKNGNEALPVMYRTTFSEIHWDDIQGSYREWQACLRYGKTYQAMALETLQFIIDDFYGSGAMLDPSFMLQVDIPYGDATINELLNTREKQDALWNEQGSRSITNGMILMIVPDGTVGISEDGTFVTVQVAWYNTKTAQQESTPGLAIFELVNNRWQVAVHQVPVIPAMAEPMPIETIEAPSGNPMIVPTVTPSSGYPTIVATIELNAIPLEEGGDNQDGMPTVAPPDDATTDEVVPVMTPPPATSTVETVGGDNSRDSGTVPGG